MELQELKSLYKAVFAEFSDKCSIGAGRRCVFVVSYDKRSFGFYDTMARFWTVPKHQVEAVYGLDTSDIVHFDGGQIYKLEDGQRRPIGREVDRVRSADDEGPSVDLGSAFTEDFWSGDEI